MRTLRAGLTGACAVAALLAVAASPARADLEPAAPPPAAAEPSAVRPAGMPGPLRDERLSDERLLTRFASPVLRSAVRRRPTRAAPTITKLRLETEERLLEVYLVLASRVDSAGRTWLRVRVPGRPNGRTGWVRRHALGPLRIVRTALRVNRRTLRATLYDGGRRIWSSRVGVGAPATPTPAGRFWIRTRLRALRGGTTYGPYAFGTSAYSVLSDWPGGGVIGVHGTDEPQLIPGRPSHGCVRVPNRNIRRLARLMPIGTPVHVL